MSGPTTHLLRRCCYVTAIVTIALPPVLVLMPKPAQGADGTEPSGGRAAITVSADFSQQWTDGTEAIAVLRGRCRVLQGSTELTAQKMVLWRPSRRSRTGRGERLTVYLEGNARLERPGQSLTKSSLLVHLGTRKGIEWEVRRTLKERPPEVDPLYRRALDHRRGSRRGDLLQTQWVVPGATENAERGKVRSVQIDDPASERRRIRIFPRSRVPYNILSRRSTQTVPPEQVTVLTGGVNVLIEGVEEVGLVDLAADRVVIWTRATDAEQFQPETVQSGDEPFTIYLEGNIVIRQGDHVLRANRAVYDARAERALLLNAELKTFVPALQAELRVRADRLRQLAEDSFHAQDAWTSTSRFGKPGYRIQASDVFVERRPAAPFPGGSPFGPGLGSPFGPPSWWVTSLNNVFFLDDYPLLYFPYLSAPAEEPAIPLRRVSAGHDDIFGTELRTEWDMFQILGLDEPADVEWNLLGDVYSKRGPAAGTSADYARSDLFGLSGRHVGEGLAYYVRDEGEDVLGRGRRSLEPETNDRYRLFLRHRSRFPNNLTVIAESGVLSDRNFLEQYYEETFDEDKDEETLLYAKQQFANQAWTALVRPQVNDFTTTTEWLPRGDLYTLGQPLLGGWLTWSQHSSASYAQLRHGDPPENPDDLFTRLPFVAEAEGPVLMTRHELNAPFHLGPVHAVPYVLGESAYWGEGFDGDDVHRQVGSAGMRSSVLFWRVFPYVHSQILGLNGLAHKIRLEGEYAWTETTEELGEIPQFNEFDDNAQERFRQRLLVNTFGGTLPSQFEPRFYAVRAGAGRPVSAPWHELVADQQVFRTALRQRLQTKVGPPEALRIKDWMTLDLEASWFPREDRDNFGEEVGLVGADYAWNVGARTRLLASARFDVFDQAAELWDVGVVSQRGRRGSVFVGLRQVEAPGLDSQILSASYTYRMTPKWISTLGTAYDLGEDRNRGQSFTVTRVGADFLVHLGLNFDESKDNAGIAFSVEPRFGPFNVSGSRLGSLLGQR